MAKYGKLDFFCSDEIVREQLFNLFSGNLNKTIQEEDGWSRRSNLFDLFDWASTGKPRFWQSLHDEYCEYDEESVQYERAISVIQTEVLQLVEQNGATHLLPDFVLGKKIDPDLLWE